MANPLDTDAGSELFSSYEAELKLVQADLAQKLDQIPELTGEPRKAAVSQAERALEEADELLGQMRLEKQNIPTSARAKVNQRFRNYESDIDASRRKLTGLSSNRAALFGSRYTDEPSGSTDINLEQRQQLLSGTERLDRSTQRLLSSQRLANETEAIGAETLADLHRQGEVIRHTHDTLLDSEGYVDRSVKTLRGMARRLPASEWNNLAARNQVWGKSIAARYVVDVASRPTMSEFLGSRISLISKSDIRYVGTLHEINSDESTVSLENVRSFGTEGRRGRPEEEIAPSDQVYEYIVFRGSDVKDLRIEEHPAIKENKPPVMPDDPAIVGVSAEAAQSQRAAPETASAAQESKPPPIGPSADKSKGAPPTELKSHTQVARQPANAPTPPVESKPSAEDVKAVATTLASNGAVKATDVPKAVPTGPKGSRVQPVLPLTGPTIKSFQPPFAAEKAAQAAPQPAAAGPSSVQDATSAARAAVALAMAQLSNTGGNAMDNLTNKVNEMRINAGRGGSASRGRGRGGRPTKVEVPDADFDFAQSNAKFNKEDIVKEATAGSPAKEPPSLPAVEGSEPVVGAAPVAYNKSKSFFDNISSEARERAENNGQKPGGREWRGEEQRRNIETFGQGSVDGGYRNYRGRGRGRGGRGGRGFSRGGRGGPRPQYQPTAAGQ
ncbi:hypothetical protein Trco_006598 [Trichoderma cornu-damae]|uniref:Uncharacterized protein n=1 Tax=Trichoderma cornu-damae TaxID=654480 RepID=A0A9P8QH39_9HYPO|nr:hypothetical protein Trco_006598 [Trichoderma cornu-damae]